MSKSVWDNRIVGHGEVRPEDLLAHPKNYRIHPKQQQNVLAGAIKDVGFIRSVTVNKRTGFVLDGHLRVALAISAGQDSLPVEYVDLSEAEEAEALAVLDPIAGLAATDHEQLGALMADIEHADQAVLEMLSELHEAQVPVGNAAPDDVPEAPEEPVTKRGDVWILGKHRVMCGDSTVMADVDRLLGGTMPTMAYTDPPYGINALTGSKEQWGGAAGNYRRVINDEDSYTALAAYRLVAEMGVPVQVFWGANHYASGLPDSPCWIVWHKKLHHDENDFADCEMAWTNLRQPARVFAHSWNGFLRDSEKGERRVHPTQKPVALAEWCFEKYGSAADAVLDLFGGSGSTLIAAEKTGSACCVMEIDPRYVDVICRRYQEYTGTLPILESTGEEHDFSG